MPVLISINNIHCSFSIFFLYPAYNYISTQKKKAGLIYCLLKSYFIYMYLIKHHVHLQLTKPQLQCLFFFSNHLHNKCHLYSSNYIGIHMYAKISLSPSLPLSLFRTLLLLLPFGKTAKRPTLSDF